PVRGIGAGEFVLDAAAVGGEYTLIVRELSGRFPEQQRKFIVNRYQKDQLNTELEWGRKSYGPGEEVLARCKVAPAEGGQVLANILVTVTIRIDGTVYDAEGRPTGGSFNLRPDDKGAVDVRFKLPKDVARGEGTLAVNFDDGAHNETIS